MSESETPADSEAVEQPDEEVPDLDPSDVDEGGSSVPGMRFLKDRMPPGFGRLMQTVQQENGLAKVMLKPVYVPDADGEPQVSQAEVIADMFNILRLDTKAMADAVGVDISIRRMTPEKAAMLLQGAIKGENLDLIEEFARVEEQRERVFKELTDEETLREHQETKASISHFYAAAGEGVDAE